MNDKINELIVEWLRAGFTENDCDTPAARTRASSTCRRAADLTESQANKLRGAVKLFERVRQFVGQEVDGASLVDLGDVETAIDKWCAAVPKQGSE